MVNGQHLNEHSMHPDPDNNPIPPSLSERRSKYGRVIILLTIIVHSLLFLILHIAILTC